MKRVFKGFIPKDQAFFYNLLFRLKAGLNDYLGERYAKDGQEFKITVIIEKMKGRIKS